MLEIPFIVNATRLFRSQRFRLGQKVVKFMYSGLTINWLSGGHMFSCQGTRKIRGMIGVMSMKF